MKIIHLTDTHFVPKGKKLYGRDPRETLCAAVADINANHADAAMVVVTGDLTHWGEPLAFESLAETLNELTPPLKLIVGNHDDRDEFRRHFPDQAVDENGFIQSFADTEIGRFVFLDTTMPGTHAGYFCEPRRAWLARILEQSAERDVFLFMHHPPFDTGLPASDRIGLMDDEAFSQIVLPHRDRIRHLFFGHIHRPIAGSWHGIPMTTLRAMNHQVGLVFEEGVELRGNFEPPAYCVALLEADRIVVHFHDFTDASTRFSLHDSPWDDWSRRHPHP